MYRCFYAFYQFIAFRPVTLGMAMYLGQHALTRKLSVVWQKSLAFFNPAAASSAQWLQATRHAQNYSLPRSPHRTQDLYSVGSH